MQEKEQNLAKSVSICGKLYSFIISIFTARRLADSSSDSCSSHSDASESEDEFWEAEDSTASDEVNETSQTETKNRREIHLVQEHGMYDATSLSLVQKKTNFRISETYPLKLETKGSPDMMKRRPHTRSMKAKIQKERMEEVGFKSGKARIISRVFTNINDRSDAFIRSRREAMRRSYSVGSKLF